MARRRRHRRHHLRDLFDFDDLGRRRRRHRRRGLLGLEGRLGRDLKDVAIGLLGGAGGLLINHYAAPVIPGSATVNGAVRGAAGILGGVLLSRVNGPLGIGLGAGMGGQAILQAISGAASLSPPLAAYTWSRRYGMHGLGQPKPTYYGWGVGQSEPGAYRLHGLGRTRVTSLPPPGIVLNAYPYSRRYGMHGLGWSYHSSAVPGVHG